MKRDTFCYMHSCNESTAGADTLVEVPKLHNIILSFYTHIIIIMMNIFTLSCMQAETRITGKIKEWAMIDHDCC